MGEQKPLQILKIISYPRLIRGVKLFRPSFPQNSPRADAVYDISDLDSICCVLNKGMDVIEIWLGID